MVLGRVNHGRVEVEEAMPEEWEGQLVKILPMTPDDPLPDLEQRLAALQELGPMEWDPGEQEAIASALAEMDNLSKADLQKIAGKKP